MSRRTTSFFVGGFLGAALLLCSTASFAQFTSSVQGVVLDPSGAGVSKAAVRIVNTGTQVAQTATSDDAGNYRFVSLAPGSYKVTVEATGFSKSEANVTLLTEQNLNVPITLKIGSISESITVSTEAPVVDTADSRTQITLESQEVAQLPVAGRNLVTLVITAPGVSGLGTGATVGTPGSGADNFSTEEAVDASANGQVRHEPISWFGGGLFHLSEDVREAVFHRLDQREIHALSFQ